MISLQSIIRAVDHRAYERSYHALLRADERCIDLSKALDMVTSNIVDAFPVYGSNLLCGMRLVTVVRCGRDLISLVWGDALGYITLITVHRGRPHEEIVVSHEDYFYSMIDSRLHAA